MASDLTPSPSPKGEGSKSNSTPAASLEKYALHFSNHVGMTEPADMPYASTGVSCDGLKGSSKVVYLVADIGYY